MRWKLVFGFGIAGAVAGSALGQFAVDRVPQTPPASGIPATAPQAPTSPLLPAGFTPVATVSQGGYAPPVGGVVPAGGTSSGSSPFSPSNLGIPLRTITAPPKVEVESVLGPNHEWALKPEHGAYFLLIKSYSRPHNPTPEDNGPSARVLAETLAGQIREIHRVQAFLYEYISDERKAEAAAIAAERERGRQFAAQLRERQRQSELQGMEFLESDNRIRFKMINYRDQIAVLVGGFNTDQDARRALDKVRTWPAPKQTILMDGAVVSNPVGNQARVETGYLNPYLSATVAPNPLIPHELQPASTHSDPFIVKFNEGCPYNLFKATKEWTLAVKSFNVPVQIVGKDTDTTAMRKSGPTKGANALAAGAIQAESMAKMLREMKGPTGQSLGLESFVLHTRNSSIVTVGQFDSPNDPALAQIQKILTSFKLNVSEDKMGIKPVGNAPTLLDAQTVPVRIPKA